MPSIKVMPSGKVYEYEAGDNLLNVLLAQGIFVDNPCNGKGVCGKCRVRILDAEKINDVTETELKLLKSEELASGVRLSCLVAADGDLVVELMQKERKHKVLTSGYMPEFEFNPDIIKKAITIHKPSLEDQTPMEDQIKEQLADMGAVRIPLDVLTTACFKEGTYTAVIYEDEAGIKSLMGLEHGDTSDIIYGCAIDIGTTTVVTSLVDMTTGEELVHSSMINAQKHFGLDVLTRITYELENPEDGIAKLQTAIVDSINDMLTDVCEQAEISRDFVYQLSVGANCTMMHMLLGVDAKAIGKSPYAPIFVRARDIEAAEIGIKVANGARLYCLPSVSSYIGADIVAGAYVCELHKADENVLFIDIGTNGEIVFSDHGRLLSCSCAAGPALEGMNISSGMRAAEGAIEDVVITENGVELKVIGDQEPIGVCGSGILAVVKELVKNGFVKAGGAFLKLDKFPEGDYRLGMMEVDEAGKRAFVMTEKPEKLLITQGDVRQVQLAKGAILSGFYALIRKAGKTMEELDKVMVAGQFGAHLPADSLIGVGILPEEVRDKLVYVGNSSKTGAHMALMSKDVKREIEELAHHMDYMELGASPDYERLFAECLAFPVQK
ncbi:MAG: ASKHA domain-containing protein [Firmicutes bacterium]|nr:ASKHA domain-containing protein [Bacillota bacterium]